MEFLQQLQKLYLVIQLVVLQFQLVFVLNDSLHKRYDLLLHEVLHSFVVQKLDMHLLKLQLKYLQKFTTKKLNTFDTFSLAKKFIQII